MSIKRAITFGSKYRDEPHPTLGNRPELPDSYVVVEGKDLGQVYELLPILFGHETNDWGDGPKQGGVAYAFDYDLEEFEARPSTKGYYPNGRILEFSALPVREGMNLELLPESGS